MQNLTRTGTIWRITSASGGITGFADSKFALDTTGFANDRSGGSFSLNQSGSDLNLVYTPPTPTAAQLLALRAEWGGAEQVRVRFQTGVEYDVIGYRLQWREDSGAWMPFSGGLIPATGRLRPTWYEGRQSGVPAGTLVTVRLLAVDLRGDAREIGTTAIVSAPSVRVSQAEGGIRLFVNAPNGSAVLETATDVTEGPWTRVQTILMDSDGAGVANLSVSHAEAMRFFRVRIE